MAVNDKQQRVTFVNAAFVDTFGYTLKDVPTLKEWWPEAYPDPEYRRSVAKAWEAELERAKRTGTPFSPMKVTVRCKDKTSKIVLATAASLSGSFEGSHLVVLFDITDRERALIDLALSEAKFATAFHTSPDAVSINRLSDGLFLEANEGFTRLTGYTREDVAGKTSIDIDIWNDPADRGRLVAGLLADGAVDNLEARFRRNDGLVAVGLMSARVIEIGGEKCILSITRDISDRKSAEEALRASEERFRVLFENANDGILVMTTQVALVAVNAAFAEMHGYTVDELLTMDLGDLETPESARLTPERLARVLAGESMSFEVEHRRKNGQVFPLEVSANLMVVGDQDYVLGFHRDITRRRLAEQALRASEERYRTITETISDVVWILDPQTLMFTYVSPSVQKLRGFTPKEIIAEPLDAAMTPGSAQRVRGLLSSRVQDLLSGRLRPGDPFTEEIEQPCKDGSTVWTEVVTSYHVDQESGRPVVHGVTRDISARRQSEDKFRSLFEQSIVASSMTKPSGEVQANQALCDLLGYTPAEIAEGATWRLFTFADDVAETERVMAAILAGTIPSARFEERFVRKDGGIVWADVSSSLRRSAKGEPEYFMTTILDISEKKRTEEELARQRERIDKTLTSVIDIASTIIETRDPYTSGHQQRVAEIATRIAQDLGMSKSETADIRVASLIHDVGKIQVPAEILGKPGRISPLEFEILKGHAEAGFSIVTSAHMDEPIAEMVYQHHERCDGSGYPRGLTGDQLLKSAKVLMVADVVEAMMSHRPYRPALGLEAALAEIERGAGVLYDAEVSRACVALFREGGFELT
jgi:PAS domain S-box-containing protein